MNYIIYIPIISVILVISFVCMFSCTSYITYIHTNKRSRVAMIEQGKNDLGEKLGPSRKRDGEKKYCVVQIKRDEMIEWLRMHFHQMQYSHL